MGGKEIGDVVCGGRECGDEVLGEGEGEGEGMGKGKWGVHKIFDSDYLCFEVKGECGWMVIDRYEVGSQGI